MLAENVVTKQLTWLSKLHVMPPCLKIVNGQNVIYTNNSNMHMPNIFTLWKLKMITIHSPAQGQHLHLKPSTQYLHQCDLCRCEAFILSTYFPWYTLQEVLALCDLL